MEIRSESESSHHFSAIISLQASAFCVHSAIARFDFFNYDQLLLSLFTTNPEVLSVVKGLNLRKSAGPDGLNNDF